MISLIIVNCNRKELLRQCLDSIRLQSFKDFEVIVVDNASADGSSELVEVEYPEMQLIRNSKNELYCRGLNIGIKESRGKFVLGLNSDVVLDRDFLKEALNAFQIDKRIGMVSGKILRMDKITIDSTGLFLGRSRKPVERGYGQMDRGQYNRPGFVFGTSGAVGFYRRAMLEDISKDGQYFNEKYGMYYEDLDLCWRANNKGWKAYYNPWAIAYHRRGGTAKSVQPKFKFLEKYDFVHLPLELKVRLIKNRYRTIFKNDNFWSILRDLIFIAAYEARLWGYVLLFENSLISRFNLYHTSEV